jgi:hypothetical protein
MRHLFFLSILFACAAPQKNMEVTEIPLAPVPPTSESSAQPGAALAAMGTNPPKERLLSELRMAVSYPCSLGPGFENDPSVEFVIEHMDEAHPLLLKMIEQDEVHGDIARAFRLLVIAGREESLPVMEKVLLSNDELDSADAGIYLGLHPSPKAFDLLLQGLSSQEKHTLFGATLGLMERKDKAACAPLRNEMTREDDSQRYYVIQAAGELGCLTRDELKVISKKDTSSDIRDKVKQLLARS